LLPHLSGLVIEGVHDRDDGVRIEAHVRAGRMACPGCERGSDRVHSRYRRTLADAPIGARTVVIQLRVRRFFCDHASCTRRTFVEQVPGLTSKHARRTGLLRQMLEAIGLALAGRAGARLAAVLGMPTSRDSLLRLVRALPDPPVGDVEVLGVDDFAIRRCHAYGTVLVDILAHRPVDLVQQRTADVLADWLGKHPGVKVICRDRSGAYAEGARTGAPEAIQVADRWHLWANLGEAVERIVLAHHACLDEPAPEPSEAQPGDTADGQPAPAKPDSTAPVEHGAPSRLETRTRERHTAVTELRDKGYSLNAICRELGLAFRTVQRFARATNPEELLVAHRTRSHKLDRFMSYVHQRWNAGVTEATVLHAELIELGWTGSLRTVQHYLYRFRDPDRAPRPAPPVPDKTTPRRVTSWIMTNPEHLSDGDQVRLKQVLARCPQLEATAGHVACFAAMMGQRSGKDQLAAWLDAVTADDLPALQSLVAGLRRDLDAVTNGLSLDYSSGQVEGNVNRIKMIKRQMFGRAKFDLLRKRVLLAH
jgi:transposase